MLAIIAEDPAASAAITFAHLTQRFNDNARPANNQSANVLNFGTKLPAGQSSVAGCLTQSRQRWRQGHSAK